MVAKILAVFSMFAKPLKQFGLMGFFTNFLQLEIKGRMWLAIRDLAAFMYNMYANGLPTVLSSHC